jgi:mannose-1-phosphate guanylyltransferase
MISPDRTLLVLTRAHERFYQTEVADVSPSLLLIQPQNWGTSAAILYSLMRIRTMDSSGLVAFFPSDHYIADDEAFAAQVDLAFSLADFYPEMVFLLGIVPEKPEASYGWIEPAALLENPYAESISRVSRFWEKPSPSPNEWPDRRFVSKVAQSLYFRGKILVSMSAVGGPARLRRLRHADKARWDLDRT